MLRKIKFTNRSRKCLLVLCAALCLTGVMASCDPGAKAPVIKPDGAFAAYSQAAEKMKTALKDAKSYVGDCEMTVKMSMGDASVPVSCKGTLAFAAAQRPRFSMDMTVNMLGQSIPMLYYCDGNALYVGMQGETYKTSYSDDLKDETLGKFNEMPDLKGVQVLEQNAVPTKDGGYVLTFTVDPKTLTDVMKDQMGEAMGDMGGMAGTESGQFSFSKMVVTSEIDRTGLPVKSSLDGTMQVSEGEVSLSAEFSMSFTYRDIGKDITITPPEGLDLNNAIEMPEDELPGYDGGLTEETI